MTPVASGWEVALCSLYLRGLGGAAPKSRWLLAAQVLREAACACPESASEALLKAGLHEESSRVSCAARWRRAACLVASGRAGSGLSEAAPSLWRPRLREAAPAAFWRGGPLPSGPWLAIVGSREPRDEDERAVHVAVQGAKALGWGVVSGGARGVDTLARQAALASGVPLLEIFPCGLPSSYPGGGLALSPAGSAFGPGAAMERNLLIYAAAQAAVVVHPRFRAGGTWHGAVGALRRHICPVVVAQDPESIAVRALTALGATPFCPEAGLLAALERSHPLQRSFLCPEGGIWPAEGPHPGTIGA